MAPRVIKGGKVIVGVSGGEYAIRGFFAGARTGGRSAAEPQSGTAWPMNPDNDIVYVGTGPPAPGPISPAARATRSTATSRCRESKTN
ncbi:MAG TPA: hypothetical protein VGG72_24450 [Bryobacteraceae bacterium]|jgi:hypothetical protein